LKIALIGYGKMGKAVEAAAHLKQHEIVARFNQSDMESLKEGNMAGIDVAIEFSRPEAAAENLKAALLLGLPVVCGTTGWDERMPEIERLALSVQGKLFISANFSIGVAMMTELTRKFAGMLSRFPEYDAYLLDIHHTQKLDSPSGTAIQLAKATYENGGRNLPIDSIREGNVVGIHEMRAESSNDLLMLRHEAKSRNAFAEGAIAASEFLVAHPPGVYGMRHLLGVG